MGAMNKASFKNELAALAAIRDELRIKAHLAKKDVQDELSELEANLRLAEEELRRTTTHAKDDVSRIGRDIKELLVELKQGFESVKRRMS